MTLKEITRYILSESVSNDEINSAIDNHKYVVVNYQGTDGTHVGERMIQPVAYGCTSAGNPVIRAYEKFGDTKTFTPGWKFLRVDRISSWRELNREFDEPPNELFNPSGDKTMSIVYNIASFDNGEKEMSDAPISSPKKKSEENPSLYRTSTETGLERLKKQLDKPIFLSDLKTSDAFNGLVNTETETGPKKKSDVKRGTDQVYTNDYNYNVFDNSLEASGRKAKRNGNYYFQKRNNGKFTKGNVLDEPTVDDTKETEDYLNKYNGNVNSVEDLRKLIGDTSKPISLQDLQDLLRKKS